MKAKHSRGLTLIELMVALAVFAILGLLSYRALSQMTMHEERVSAELERWRVLGRAMQRVESDLLQSTAPESLPNSGAVPAMQLIRLPGLDNELQMLVADGSRQRVMRVGYRFSEGHLDWLRWPARVADGEPETDTLIDEVRRVRWRFVFQGRRLDTWPPDNTRTDLLPQAVELELELDHVGTINRLFTLH